MTGGLESPQRDRRAVVLALSAALVVGVVVAAVLLKPDRPRHRAVASGRPTPTQTAPAAPESWVAGLGPRAPLTVPVLLEDQALFPRSDRPVQGVAGTVVAATPFDGGLLVSWSVPGSDDAAHLSFLTDKGVLEEVAARTTYGHAVDATGTRVAFGSHSSSDVRVVRVGTGRRLAATRATNDKYAQPGTAVAWWNDMVLLTTGDGAASGVHLWDTTTGAVTRVGDPGQYGTAAAVVGNTALLHQGDGPCTAAVALPALTSLWQSCDVFVAGSPSGSHVLVRQETPEGVITGYQVRAASTGGGPVTLALPAEGVLSAGWSDDKTVAAVVLVRSDDVESWLVVACPASGAGCRRVHQYSLGTRAGPAAGLALVVSARS